MSATAAQSKGGAHERPYLVVNPRSANGSTGRHWAKLEAQARAALGDLTVGMTEGPLHATTLTREAIRAGHRTIYAVGGDGTVNEVVNGFFDEDGHVIAADAAIGVISSLAALKVFDEIYVLTNRTGGILNSGVTMVFYLWQQAFERSNAGYASAIAIVLLVVTLGFSIVNVRLLERGEGPAR